MAICDVCSKTEFALEDGHYVCIECNTVLEDEVEVVQEHSQATCSTTIRASQDVSLQQMEFSGSEYDWTLYDAFNIILCHMTNALIHCGVSPEVRPMVLTLWAAWLSKMGIAFTAQQRPHESESEHSEAFDDFSMNESPNMTLEGPDPDYTTRSEASFSTARSQRELPFCYENIVPKKKKRRKKSTERDLSEFDDTLTEREKRQERKRRETAYLRTQRTDEESTGGSTLDPDSADETLSESARSSHSRLSCLEELSNSDSDSGDDGDARAESKPRPQKLLKNASFVRKEPEYMTLPKLLSFLHAALIVNGEHYSHANIIRWVREGHIPFFGAFKILPSTMKLTGKSANILGAAGCVKFVPSSVAVRRNTARLLRMLGFKKIAKPPVMPFISKLVQDLQLPSEILGQIRMLVDQVNAVGTPSSIVLGSHVPSIEARAAAFVLMALKLLFGLDDYTEKQISDFAERVNSSLGLKPASEFTSQEYPVGNGPHLPTLFSWKEWMRYINYRRVILKHYHVPTALRLATVAEMDPDYLTRFCRGRGKLWLYPKKMNREKKHTEICQQTAELLLNTFQDSDREAETIEFKPASLSFQGLAQQLLDKDRVKFKGVEQRFTETSISFLWEPQTLMNVLEKAGQSLDQYPFFHPTDVIQQVEMRRNWDEELRGRSSKSRESQFFEVNHGYLTANGLEKTYWTLHAHTEIARDQRWRAVSSSLPYDFQWTLALLSEATEEHPKVIYNQLTVLEDLICFKNFSLIRSMNSNRVLKTRAKDAEGQLKQTQTVAFLVQWKIFSKIELRHNCIQTRSMVDPMYYKNLIT